MCRTTPTDAPSTLLPDGIAAVTTFCQNLCHRGMDLTEYKKRGFDPRPYMIGAFAGVFFGVLVGRWLCNLMDSSPVQRSESTPAAAPPIPLQVYGNAMYGVTGNEANAVYGVTDNGANAPAEGEEQDDENEERQSVMDITSLFRQSVDSRAETTYEGEGTENHSADAASVNQNPLGNPRGNSTGSLTASSTGSSASNSTGNPAGTGYAANSDMVADMA